MCDIKFISQQTGLSEEELLSDSRKSDLCSIRDLCFNCLQRKGVTLVKIAEKFGRKSHATVINGIKVLENNPKHPTILKAKKQHKCFMEATEVIEVKTEKLSLEDVLFVEMMTTSVLSKKFEEVVRARNIFDRKYSPQRT